MNPPPLRSPRSPVASFFVGLWDLMNFTRRLIFNLVFFGGLLLLAVLFLAGSLIGSRSGPKPLGQDTTLVIAPEGRLVEQYSSDPVTRALSRAMGDSGKSEVQLRDLMSVLRAAGKDDKITRVVLELDKFGPSGFASLRELGRAVDELRGQGKQVVAYSQSMGQGQYLLAAHADEVYLDPMGGLMLEGLSGYRQYYRTLLADKLGVDMQLFKVGEYKSAAEPYVLDAASAESKEADLYWMGDIWQRYVADVAAARKLDVDALNAGIDTLPEGVMAAGGDLARHALQLKLVDGLKTRAEFDALIAQRGKADEDEERGYRWIGIEGYQAHLARSHNPLDSRPQVAVVVAEGAISGGKQPAGSVGGESTSALLRAAREDDKVKAVVLRVDSPGGEVFASEQIRREVVALKAAGKPVVASMGDVAASGGYWISMDTDAIWADESTITGSIGIFGMIPNLSRALGKVGVSTDGVATTRFAGAFDPTRPMDPGVAQVIQAVIEKGYNDFIGGVAAGRGKSVEEIDQVARGRVWSGVQAHERGLVDSFGGLREAVADAAARAKLGSDDRWRIRYIEKEGTPFEQFLAQLGNSPVGAALLGRSGLADVLMLGRVLPQADADLRFVQQQLQQAGPGQPPKVLAHCFCEL
ncbi:MAG: signal peptide peptidase SppA [Stenotrophomonas sp.]